MLTSKQENGVDTAIQSLYRDLEYATSLIKAKTGKHSSHHHESGDGTPAFDDADEEESWTFVGSDADGVEDLHLDSVLKRPSSDFDSFAAGGKHASGSNKPLGRRAIKSPGLS
jgi:sterol 3beta-glucosyltransferase